MCDQGGETLFANIPATGHGEGFTPLYGIDVEQAEAVYTAQVSRAPTPPPVVCPAS